MLDLVSLHNSGVARDRSACPHVKLKALGSSAGEGCADAAPYFAASAGGQLLLVNKLIKRSRHGVDRESASERKDIAQFAKLCFQFFDSLGGREHRGILTTASAESIR